MHTDIEERRAYQREWHAKNRERIAAQRARRRRAKLHEFLNKEAAARARRGPEKLAASHASWYHRNRDEHLAKQRAKRVNDPETHLARDAKYRAADPEAMRARTRQWRARNPEASAAINRACAARHRAEKKRSCPPWAERDLIALVYAEAIHRGMVVDHVIPLRGKKVCGLHVHNNLQLLTSAQNATKLNRFEPITEFA